MDDIIKEEKEYLEHTKDCLEKEEEYCKKEMKEIQKRLIWDLLIGKNLQMEKY